MTWIDHLLNIWLIICHPGILPEILAWALLGAAPVWILAAWIVVDHWRRNPPRMKLGTLLVAVAILGVILGAYTWGAKMNRRGTDYIMKSTYYISLSREYKALKSDPALAAEERAALERKADHYSRLSQKYRAAWQRPWRPVAPDPPEPE